MCQRLFSGQRTFKNKSFLAREEILETQKPHKGAFVILRLNNKGKN